MPLKPVRRPKSPHWILRGTIGGRRIEESTGLARYEDAKRYAEKRTAELLERRIHGDAALATFAEAVVLYLEAGGESRFVGKLLDHFNTRKLSEINTRAVAAAARKLYPTAKHDTIIRQVYVPMTAILNCAADEELCPPPRIKRPKRPASQPKRIVETPPDDWFDRVLPECKPKLGAFLVFLAFTGARTSEAVRLDWADVDLATCYATIHTTKNGEPRLVRLPVVLVAMLANLPGPKRKGAVFGWSSKSSVYEPLKRACKRAGVPYYIPHAAGRHTFATRLLKLGKSLQLVKDAGGWKSIRIVSETYGHLERADIDLAVDQVGENWGKGHSQVSKTETGPRFLAKRRPS